MFNCKDKYHAPHVFQDNCLELIGSAAAVGPSTIRVYANRLTPRAARTPSVGQKFHNRQTLVAGTTFVFPSKVAFLVARLKINFLTSDTRRRTQSMSQSEKVSLYSKVGQTAEDGDKVYSPSCFK